VRPSDLIHRLQEATVSASTRLTRRTATVLAALLIAVAALPTLASARPMNGPGYEPVAPSTPAETVVRTVVTESSVPALPIALAGAALIVAIAGSGYAMVRIAPLRRQFRGQH
jgi:hypothetical protein